MIHMLSSFMIEPGEDEAAFRAAYARFVADLRAEGQIAEAGPLGRRIADTPMDTDAARHHTHFSILSFHDRAQLDHAYASLARRTGASAASHHDIHARIADSVFLCWHDCDETEPEET